MKYSSFFATIERFNLANNPCFVFLVNFLTGLESSEKNVKKVLTVTIVLLEISVSKLIKTRRNIV